jgi:hypothetical protein
MTRLRPSGPGILLLMECVTRRLFVASLAGIASQGLGRAQSEVAIERDLPGKPHAGKVLAAIQPHSDDIPTFAQAALQVGVTRRTARGVSKMHAPPHR